MASGEPNIRHIAAQAKQSKAAVDRYFRVLDDVASRAPLPGSPPTVQPKIDMSDEIAREQKIKNDNAEQDITLKRTTLDRLFRFLAIETIAIFLFAFFQAIGRPDGFHLDNWSFRIVVGATIAQITGMLFVAVRYLFPKK